MEWRPKKRISSLTPPRRRWRISGAMAPPRRSSASTRPSYTTPPRRQHAAHKTNQGDTIMVLQDFTTTFLVDLNKTPTEVFAAINNVRGWWGEDVEGSNDNVGDEFTYRVKDVHYSRIKVIELIPNQRVVWLVLDNHLNFVDDQSEWVGTKITFEI